jgi:hypothetical protein
MSAYRIKGSDQIYLRTKGGASKERIQNDPAFDTTRRLNSEFGGRASCAKRILKGMFALKMLADHNVSAPLNKRLKPVQELDTASEFGKRNIMLSANPKLLEAFSFNTSQSLEHILGAPIKLDLSRENLSADITIPQLITGINFRGVQKYPFYSFVFCLAVIPDMFWTAKGYQPSFPEYDTLAPVLDSTEWFPSVKGSTETSLTLALPAAPPNDQCVIALGIGMRFGNMISKDMLQQVKFGCGKILSVV